MKREYVFNKIVEVIKRVLSEDCVDDEIINAIEFTEKTNLFADTGLDSIQILTVITEIEEEFDIEFIYEDMDMDYIIVLDNMINAVINAMHMDNKESSVEIQ